MLTPPRKIHAQHAVGMRHALFTLGALVLLLLLAWLYFSSAALWHVPEYLTLHQVFESLSIVVAALVFAVGWHAGRLNSQRNVRILASGFLGVALLDFAHMLSFAGMPAFITPNSVAKSIWFWLPARYMAAFTLLLVVILPWKPPETAETGSKKRLWYFALVLVFVATIHVLVLYYPQVLPAVYDEQLGLSKFKIAAEYGLMVLHALAFALLLRQMRGPTAFDAPPLLTAIGIMGLAELFFTLYVHAADQFNLLGHVYKVIGYLFLYRSVFLGTIEAPYRALAQSERSLKAVLNAVPDPMFELTRGGRYLQVPIRHMRLLAARPEKMVGRSIDEVLPAAAAAVVREALAAADAYGHTQGQQLALDLADGRHWFELSVARMQAGKWDEPNFVVLSRDITQRLEDLDELRKLHHAVEQTPHAIIITDLQGAIEYVNPAFTAVTGYRFDEVVGRNPRMLRSDKTAPEMVAQLWAHLTAGKPWRGELLNRRKDGQETWTSVLISPVRDGRGIISHYLSVQEDISERKRNEERIRHLANFDVITDLPNRAMFAARFSQALALSQRSDGNLALLYLDLDRFKNVNDSLGHAAGDALLMDVARRIKALLRAEDTVTRYGGDEFLVALPLTTAQDAAHMAELLQTELRKSCQLAGHSLVVTSSIGIALYPDDGRDLETLARHAEVAMLKAKEMGRNHSCFFSPDMQAHSSRVLRIENGLRTAIAQGQMAVHFQPQWCLHDRRMVGAEALLRWTHPELGTVSPGEFISVAEGSGQIIAIGRWVLDTALAQLRRWQDAGHADLTLAVNLSLAQFRHPDLVASVEGALQRAGVAAHALELELTESIAMHEPEKAIAVVQQLADMGVQLSLDDFGTGYSSFSYLQRLRVHRLKIDQSFVRNIDNVRGLSIVRAIVDMSRSLGLTTIAEGVETAGQFAALQGLSCDMAQGYYLSYPLSVAEFDALLSRTAPGPVVVA